MKNNVGDVFVLLVCNEDGAVIPTFDDCKQLLNESARGSGVDQRHQKSQANVFDKRF